MERQRSIVEFPCALTGGAMAQELIDVQLSRRRDALDRRSIAWALRASGSAMWIDPWRA
jgi:hypothetical protein